MKRPALIAVLVLASTATVAGTWKTMLSPGPLATAHQELDGNCDACHMSFAGVPNERCLTCHEGLAARIAKGGSFHATLSGEECIACHGDHAGREATLTKAPALEAFDHSKTGFTLAGSHDGVKCETCHDKPVHEMAGSCAQCHDDPHSSSLGPACNSCHEAVVWADVKTLAAHLLSMEGKHSQQQCNDCHLHGDNLDTDAPCSNCHQDTHGGTVALCSQCHEVSAFTPAKFDHGPCTCAFPGKHQTVECLACHEGFQFTNTPTVCSGCHLQDRPHDPVGECSSCHTAISWVDNRFDHNKQAAFKIEGSHESVSCVQCHTDGSFRGISTVCEDCHGPTGLEAHGDFSSHGGCASCHEITGFSPSTFDHATTGFSLDGKHGTLGCQGCHDGKVDGYPGATP